jgi:type I restriction enzyme R subunit
MNKLSPLDFREDAISKFPALYLLIQLGYKYISPEEALALRGGRLNNVLLDGVLASWLRKNNTVRFKNQEIPFTEGNIFSAMQALREVPFDGLIRTNEKIYDLLCLGKSLQQSVDGDTKSFTLRYIDWEHPGNNAYHVTEEYAVEQSGSHQTRRPDIVLFVNGIPLAVIECKSPHLKDPIKQAISQNIRNQKDNGIPGLFIYSQILLALSKNEAKYATTGTSIKFWAVWREEEKEFETLVQSLINTPMSPDQTQHLLGGSIWTEQDQGKFLEKSPRLVTEQDRIIYALCRPERLLELTYRFILFDAGEKKIARYQQYFCVKNIINRIASIGNEGRRNGGVVWHTQGSGKSLTMVMLAKSISLSHGIDDYRIVLVTDRIDLDDQIYTTFHHCGKKLERAKTGADLASMLSAGEEKIIATVIDKFDAVVGRFSVRITNPNIFVLVDESHRGQYGPRHAKMQRVLPNACYIGFTGTPVMKKDKNTIATFGGLIAPAYTIDRAVNDQAVVPLLYEGRHVEQIVDAQGIDSWFEKITSSLNPEQAADLKRKFSSTDQLNKAEQKVKAIAWDISTHFRDNWQGTGFKGQLVCQDKATALMYRRFLNEFAIVWSELLISGPDEREGEEDIYEENKEEVQRFWKIAMQRFGNEKEYNKQIINAFKKSEHPEIIIVVDKLLTGFDAPCNTVLYLTRKLKDHSLLQAIARVNRLDEGKEYGYIIDYRGILQNLDHALDLYGSLPEFDAEDLKGILTDIQKILVELPQKHSVLWDIFKAIQNRKDEEEYERLLVDKELRNKFYEHLSSYSRTLGIAMSSTKFLEETKPGKVDAYRKDLAFFIKLRSSIQHRYAEIVDFGEYEPKIQKLLDIHVGTGEVETITPLINIFDKEAFAHEIASLSNESSRADTIAHRVARSIHEHIQEDPAFYKRFSEMLNETIRAFREDRLKANEYLKKVTEIMNAIVNRTDDDIPQQLKNKDVAKAYYGTLHEILNRFRNSQKDYENFLADTSLAIDEVIERQRKVNWVQDMDTQNRMKNEIEDRLFELKKHSSIDLTYADIDAILEQCLSIARVRRP